MLRIGKLKLLDEMQDIPPDAYRNFRMYYNELDYWIVYHSMKEFLEESFSIDDVRQMHDVHEIAQKVINISATPKYELEKIIKTNSGKLLATCHYDLKVPLTDAAWKLTPLQYEFLVLSHPNMPENVADTWEEFVEMEKRGELRRH